VAIAIVTADGQVTIPDEVREALCLKPGSTVEFIESGQGQFTIVASSVTPLQAMEGILRNQTKHPVTIEEMNEAIASEVVRQHRRSLEK
jgi:antitoxin PrlF